MAQSEVVGLLKLLINEKRLKLGYVETKVGLPANNLSGILKNKKSLPIKFIEPIKKFIENEQLVEDEFEKKLKEIFDKNNTEENRMNLLRSISGTGIIITKITENGYDILEPLSDEWDAVYNSNCRSVGNSTEVNIEIKDLAKKTESKFSVDTTKKDIPPIPVRGEKENAIDFAARKNEWKAKYC